MKRFRNSFFLSCLLLIGIFSLQAQSVKNEDAPYVVMLSMDAFRWDYHSIYSTPNMDSIAAHGVHADLMKSCFPTKTFPNHYSIATGLYPDHHGIVANTFYDPASGRTFKISDRTAVGDPYFYGGEPIWVSAKKQGIITASLFWVGTEAPIEGIQPDYWKPYDGNLPFEQRIDTVIAWLSLPEKIRPHLITWYFDQPDAISHKYGPLSPETGKMVVHLDSLMGVFMKKLKELPIASKVNFIIVSDHGMCEISHDRVIYLNNYINKDWFDEISPNNPLFLFKVKKEYADTAFKALKSIPHVSVWKHGEVPERLHYGTNPRTLDFILVADSAWQVTDRNKISYGKGNHGYDNDNPTMGAIFYATGPAFKTGWNISTFNNVDIYPMIAHILGIKPVKMDGKLEDVMPLLK